MFVKQEEQLTKLAIMGGTFDPIHIGHLVTAEEVRHEFGIDKVLFIPTGHPPHKSHVHMTTGEHRYLMTVLATAANPNFDVSRIEIEREGVTYTIDTIKELKKIYGDSVRLYFITGADAVHQILTWKNSSELLRICEFVAVTRPGYKTEELKKKVDSIRDEFGDHIHFLEVPALAISSSNIRERRQNLKPIKYLVPEVVENYIIKHQLYSQRICLSPEEKQAMFEYVSSKLSAKRYAHTKGVIEMALEFAKLYDVNVDEVFIAALFHDVAKEMSEEDKWQACKTYNIELDDFEKRYIDLAHGKISAALLEDKWNIHNQSILDSIRYHTFGRSQMTNLDKIIYLADMTEEGRSPYKGKEQIKNTAYYSLDKAMYQALLSSKNYVVNILKQELHPITDKLIEEYSQLIL
jgi:nicotinate-nucleotide adenylyltransferase